MGKQQKNIKNQKNPPVKKLTSEEKREQERLIEKELKKEKLSAVFEKALSSKLILLPIAVLCFGIMCAVCYINGYRIFHPEFHVNGLFHCLYVGDFSIGLSSRLLIGSIMSLLTDKITADAIDSFSLIFLIISFILQSLITAAVIRKGIIKKDAFMLILSVIFVMNPLTVCMYTAFSGILDLYNYVVFLVAAMILIKGRSGVQLVIPVLSVAGLLIHYSFFMAFFPALFVIGLYRTVKSSGKQLKTEAAALTLNSVLSVGGFFYLTLFAKDHLRMTADEMIAYVRTKTDSADVFIYDDYLKYYLYDIFKGEQMYGAKQSLTELIKINLTLSKPGEHLKFLLFISVLLIIFFGFIIAVLKKEKGKGRLPFIAALIMPLALIPELILSSDVGRWIAGTAYSVILVIFAFYLMNVPSAEAVCEDIKNLKKPLKLTGLAAAVIYIAAGLFFLKTVY